jgi:hypothetical protein
MNLGHDLAGLTDQIRLDFEPEGQVAAVTCFGDLCELVCGLGEVLPRVRTSGRIE